MNFDTPVSILCQRVRLQLFTYNYNIWNNYACLFCDWALRFVSSGCFALNCSRYWFCLPYIVGLIVWDISSNLIYTANFLMLDKSSLATLSFWCSVIYKLTCFTQFLRRPFYLYSPWCVHLQVPLHTGDLTCLNLCIALRCLIINTYRAILIFAHIWAIAGVIDWSAPEKLRNHSPTPNILLMLEIEWGPHWVQERYSLVPDVCTRDCFTWNIVNTHLI